MQVLLIVILFVLVFTILLAVFGIYFLFGDLVQLEHDRYRDNWQHDGCPFGFFRRPDTGESVIWNPKYVFKFGQSIGISLQWFLRAPRWAVDDLEAIRLLWWFRACVLYWNLGMFSLIGFLLWAAVEANRIQISN